MSIFPQMKPMVGYAKTATDAARRPGASVNEIKKAWRDAAALYR